MSKPICETCNDTHRMMMADDHLWPCTRCPMPCGKCRGGDSAAAYCARTPCGCECHRGDDRFKAMSEPTADRDALRAEVAEQRALSALYTERGSVVTVHCSECRKPHPSLSLLADGTCTQCLLAEVAEARAEVERLKHLSVPAAPTITVGELSRLTVREACKRRTPLDGADAEALEHALAMTETERDEARRGLQLATAAANAATARLAAVERERDEARVVVAKDAEVYRNALLAGNRERRAWMRELDDRSERVGQLEAFVKAFDQWRSIPEPRSHAALTVELMAARAALEGKGNDKEMKP